MTPEVERPKVWLRSGNGLAILSTCIKAADKAGWSLKEWRAFSRKARAADWEAMFALVCSRFDVACAASFSKDPTNWRVDQSHHEEEAVTDD